MGLIISRKKKQLLDEYNWYKNMNFGYTHPHCMDFMSYIEIMRCSVPELEYKLENGSRAPIPENLKKKRR